VEEGKAVGYGFLASAEKMGGTGVEGEAEDGGAGIGSPAGAALARYEREDGEAMGVGGQGGGFVSKGGAIGGGEEGTEPIEEVAAFGEGAAEEGGVAVKAVAPEAGRDGRDVSGQEDAHRAAGAYLHGDLFRAGAAATQIAGDAVAYAGEEGDVTEVGPPGGEGCAEAAEGVVSVYEGGETGRG
jgi:hypothetical protein